MTAAPDVSIRNATDLTKPFVQTARDYTAYLQAVERYPRARVEYIHGDVIVTPAPGTQHQRIARNLIILLDTLSKSHLQGEVFGAPLDVELETGVAVVQPDVLFVQRARIAAIVQEQRITGAPDLLVEILSPSTARIDRAVKLQTYARYGVAEYWIVAPVEMTVEVYTLQEQGYLVAGVYGPGETIAAGQFAQAKISVDAVFGSENKPANKEEQSE